MYSHAKRIRSQRQRHIQLLPLKWLFMFIVFVVASCLVLCVCHRAFPTMNERKMREKRIMCGLRMRMAGRWAGMGDGDEKKKNLHTTPSFYRHLSAIFMFSWADCFFSSFFFFLFLFPFWCDGGVSFIVVRQQLKKGIISMILIKRLQIIRLPFFSSTFGCGVWNWFNVFTAFMGRGLILFKRLFSPFWFDFSPLFFFGFHMLIKISSKNHWKNKPFVSPALDLLMLISNELSAFLTPKGWSG